MNVCVSHPLLLHFESICQISGNSGPLGVSGKQEDLNHRVWAGEQALFTIIQFQVRRLLFKVRSRV